jgi:O-antigen/teichoic acid export membrane protein
MSECSGDSRRLTVQSLSSVGQVVISAVALFFLYKLLLRNVGIAHVGIWSLVMSMGALAQVAQLGLSGSVVRYVAKYAARGETVTVARVVRTAALSTALLYCIVLAVGNPLIRLFLMAVLPPESLPLALRVLPHAICAFWLVSVAGVYQAGLEGCRRYLSRNLILACDALSYVALCAVLTPRYGLVGLAWSRVVQNVITLLACRVALSRHLSGLGPLWPVWDRALFAEMVRYAVSFQAVSILALLFEPMMKGFLSRFGSVAAVGYFEMASRLVTQVRALIVGAVQVIVPYLSGLHETAPERVAQAYVRACEVVFYLSVLSFGTLIAAIPLIARVWIGEEAGPFIGYAVLLALGWCLNTICVPAYFAGMGSGRLRWNLVSHVVMVALNALMGTLLGLRFGGDGVVAAWAVSLAFGGAVVGVAYHRENRISTASLIPPPGRSLAVASTIGNVIAYGIRRVASDIQMPVPAGYAMVVLFVMTTGVAFWKNPTRRYILDLLVSACRRQGVAIDGHEG